MATGGLTERAHARITELLEVSPYGWRKIPSVPPETSG
jgi:hypothetical protein